MGLTINNSNTSDNNENPEIPEDYYRARFKEANPYVSSDGSDKLAIIFEVPHDGDLVEVGLFHTAKLTTYSTDLKSDGNVSDSDLGALFDRIDSLDGIEAELRAILEVADWFDPGTPDGEVPTGFLTEMEGGFKADAEDDSIREKERELIATAIERQLKDRFFRVQVVTPGGDGGSLVQKVSGEVSEDDVESEVLLGDDEEEALFDETEDGEPLEDPGEEESLGV